MTVLIYGMIIFFGVHVLTTTPLRDLVVNKIGEKPYKGLFSLISLAGLIVMIRGFSLSRSGPDAANVVYAPPEWGLAVTAVLVLAGLIILASFHGKGHMKKFLKQAMAVGVGLWALGHLFSNGNLSEILFFGGFLVYAIFDYVISTARGKVPRHTPRVKSDIIAVVVGVLLFALVFFFHFNLFGVSVY
jgi:uncharacterized membrane protein